MTDAEVVKALVAAREINGERARAVAREALYKVLTPVQLDRFAHALASLWEAKA